MREIELCCTYGMHVIVSLGECMTHDYYYYYYHVSASGSHDLGIPASAQGTRASCPRHGAKQSPLPHNAHLHHLQTQALALDVLDHDEVSAGTRGTLDE